MKINKTSMKKLFFSLLFLLAGNHLTAMKEEKKSYQSSKKYKKRHSSKKYTYTNTFYCGFCDEVYEKKEKDAASNHFKNEHDVVINPNIEILIGNVIIEYQEPYPRDN